VDDDSSYFRRARQPPLATLADDATNRPRRAPGVSTITER
jgi:hypothetical protein